MRRSVPTPLNVVVLASDGVANVGVTDPTVLTEQITQAGEEGIHLVTVGYGMGNYNDHLMEQLADQGDGFYRYVDTFEEAERAVRRRPHADADASSPPTPRRRSCSTRPPSSRTA